MNLSKIKETINSVDAVESPLKPILNCGCMAAAYLGLSACCVVPAATAVWSASNEAVKSLTPNLLPPGTELPMATFIAAFAVMIGLPLAKFTAEVFFPTRVNAK
ncbi:hypothetical protein A2634_01870 [Candidatus Amesbacteria bacterium RIFCSPHIGHO2_01_FULL_48_32]|uniref:Uncharacterized protein n=1 Tax=Candidatus Amesbacteria bacterium RIFCSPLOWO2_01_FULL_48_25 TaxID=1797259 RepID=A0A1F4ZDP5_9BACT|nr:MAG: hypothetical protein A2634_01870 [Candidatus Amesbacteria bacterium RIFCSPHIGHO2_01_FULL_48_32]OGD04338.1 MAG: hypothetical protein A2989_04870 [Candidatus Amesbacteria bacterium RIFCSPLOWO2_01_FULL_48_25]HJZ06172.1 hypothetical protein [Patescibacteria group bacterium]